MKKLHVFLALSLLHVTSAFCQEEGQDSNSSQQQASKDSTKEANIDDYYIDFAVPDLSALSMLGVDNDEIVRPGNLKEFAAALSNYVDTDGSLRPALALEWTFMKTFSKKKPVNWTSTFQPRNLAISLATTTQDSLGLRLGLGFKWAPIDKSDPLGSQDFYNRIGEWVSAYYEIQNNNLNTYFNLFVQETLDYTDINEMNENEILLLFAVQNTLNASPESVAEIRKDIKAGDLINLDSTFTANLDSALSNNPLSDELTTEVKQVLVSEYIRIILQLKSSKKSFGEYTQEVIREEKEEFKKKHWNACAFELSGGYVGYAPDVTYESLRGEKLSFFSGFATPAFSALGKNKNNQKVKDQIIFQGKYNLDLSGDSIDFSQYSFGLRYLLGNSDNRFSLEGMYVNSESTLIGVEMAETSNISYIRYTAGCEIKIMNGTWLELAFGGQTFLEGENEGNSILANFGFKHAIQNKRRHNNF